MKRSAVRCRCGHQVLAKEVLRTDLYERPSGREYVYVKYRCRRCKRVGETFIAENRWDWRIFEVPPGEMSEAERDAFADQSPISSEDLIDFHRLLQNFSAPSQLDLREGESTVSNSDDRPQAPEGSTPFGGDIAKNEAVAKPPRTEPKRGDVKSSNDALNSNPDVETKKDGKKDVGKTGGPEDGVAR